MQLHADGKYFCGPVGRSGCNRFVMVLRSAGFREAVAQLRAVDSAAPPALGRTTSVSDLLPALINVEIITADGRIILVADGAIPLSPSSPASNVGRGDSYPT